MGSTNTILINKAALPSLPIFSYLIILDTHTNSLGHLLLIVGALVLTYICYLIYDFKVLKKDHVSADRLLAILILIIFSTLFFACFEQAGSSITV